MTIAEAFELLERSCDGDPDFGRAVEILKDYLELMKRNYKRAYYLQDGIIGQYRGTFERLAEVCETGNDAFIVDELRYKLTKLGYLPIEKHEKVED